MPLSDRQARDAASYNRSSASAEGWVFWYPAIARELGLKKGAPPTPKAFARAIYKWQRTHGLGADGKIGSDTWAKLKPKLGFFALDEPEYPRPPWMRFKYDRSPKIQPLPFYYPNHNAPWMRVAKYEEWWWNGPFSLDETEVDWDERYFACSPRWGNRTHGLGVIRQRDNTDWCAAFVNYCLHRAGYSHTGSAGASSFLRRDLWDFEALDEPRPGCVIVVDTNINGGGQHVSFLAEETDLPRSPGGSVAIWGGRSYRYLGGNQGDTVKTVSNRRNLLATTDSNGNTSPYLWPRQGAPNCNISIAIETVQQHFCYPGHNPRF